MLPDDALVCRGGTCTAERFKRGAGVTIDGADRLHGVSVNSAAGVSVRILATSIPNRQIGVTTVGAVRAFGGDVVAAPAVAGPFHCLLHGLTPPQAEELFTPTMLNPNV